MHLMLGSYRMHAIRLGMKGANEMRLMRGGGGGGGKEVDWNRLLERGWPPGLSVFL